MKMLSVADHRRTIAVAALGLWGVDITLGAMKVILPVYFASVGVSISKIALLFFLFKLTEVLAPMGQGAAINRFGYRRGLIGALGLHSLLCLLYLNPTFALIYLERLVRGLVGVRLLSSVYVKHFSPKGNQRFHINMLLGLADVSKGIGMFIGGVLIAIFALEYSIGILGLLTAGVTLILFFYLPDLRETARTPVLKIWGTVDRNMKILGVARGLLLGAWDGWGIVILPVYLTLVFGLSPALVGTVMMGVLMFQGLSVTLLSKYMTAAWDSRQTLVGCGLLLFLVCLGLSFPMAIYPFLLIVFLYQFINSACGVYYNHLQLDFATDEKTSLDLATYKTISNALKPIAVFVSGVLAEALGFSWAFYFSSLLILLSALTCLALPKVSPRLSSAVQPYADESVAVK